MTNKILARVIIEIMASPKEHVKEVLDLVTEKLKNEKNFKIVKSETSKIKEIKGFYSAFSEFEIEFETIADLLNLCFDYMPSSVEILEPEKIELDSHYFMDLTNDILAKLHQWDMLIKNVHAKNLVLTKRLNEKEKA